MSKKINKSYNPWIKYTNPKLKHKPLNSSVELAKVMKLIYKYSPAGSLIEIARDQQKLTKFNKEAVKLGYQLTIDHDAIVPPKALTPVRLTKI